MASYLTKNGEPVSALIPSVIHPLPFAREECWHDCTVVTADRVLCVPTDIFGLQIPGCSMIPFRFLRSKTGVEGWDNVGQILY